MRIRSTLYSIITDIFYRIIIMIFGLIMPRLILRTYGSEINGLTSLINQILNIVSLLQAGAVGASVYELFRPFAEENYTEINIIVDSSRRFFDKIGTIFMVIILMIAPFIAYTQNSNHLKFCEIILSVIILGFAAALNILSFSKSDIVLASYQKRYLTLSCQIFERLAYYGILFYVLFTRLHFIYMYLGLLVANILRNSLAHYFVIRVSNNRIKRIRGRNNYKIQNRGYVFSIQAINQVVNASPILLITKFYGLNFVSIYSVYYMVINLIKMVLQAAQYATFEPLGNYVRLNGAKKIKSIFNTLEFLFYYSGVFLIGCTSLLIVPFILLYTANVRDISYYFPILGIMLSCECLSFCIYQPIKLELDVLGLYKETYQQEVLFGIIAVTVSYMVTKTHFVFAPIGAMIFYILSSIYGTFVLYNKQKELDFSKTVKRLLLLVLSTIVSFFFQTTISNYIYSWGSWIIVAIICASVIFIYLYVFTYFKEKEAINYFKKYLSKYIKK